MPVLIVFRKIFFDNALSRLRPLDRMFRSWNHEDTFRPSLNNGTTSRLVFSQRHFNPVP